MTPYAAQMSGSGPIDYRESERSIRGYVETAAAHGFPTTLFAHPEVALGNMELLLALEEQGACLGLHLHPYKLKGQKYRCDLGAYSASGDNGQCWTVSFGSSFKSQGYFLPDNASHSATHEAEVEDNYFCFHSTDGTVAGDGGLGEAGTLLVLC